MTVSNLTRTLTGASMLLLAGIAQAVTVDFEDMLVGAYYGKNNIDDATQNCSAIFNCYSEDGFAFGTVYDSSSPFSHIHRESGANTGLAYHGDSAGIYVRATDLSAFSLDSLQVRGIAGDNGTEFTLIGFSEAYNPGLGSTTPDLSNQVAIATIDSNGLFTAGSDFSNISAFWIHYAGYPSTPSDGTDWNIVIDNVQLSAAVTPVPLPGMVWLLAPALIGLATRQRKSAA